MISLNHPNCPAWRPWLEIPQYPEHKAQLELQGLYKMSTTAGNSALAAKLPHWSSWQNNAAKSWWNDKGLRRCMFIIIALYGSVFAFGYDGALISSVQAQPSWEKAFDNPTSWRLGVISSSYLFPQLPFPFLGSWLMDKYGRKPVIFIASVLGIVGPLISGLGHNEASFISGRIVTGISAALYMVAAPSLVAEIAHPRFRHAVQGSYYSGYFVGSFICGWVGFGCVTWDSDWSWRVLTILQCLGCIPLLFLSPFAWMTESPRWLVKKGRNSDALRILADLHGNGDENDELVRHEMSEIVAAVEFDGQIVEGRFRDFLTTKGNRHRLACVIWFAWALCMSGNNLLAYYLPVILVSIGFTDSLKIQGLLAGNSAWALVVSLIGGQLLERLGRRKLLLYGSVLTVLMFAGFTGSTAGFVESGSAPAGKLAIAFLFFFGGSFVLWGFPLPYTYVPEILPFHLRGKGLAIYQIVTNGGALYNSLVNATAIEAIGWKYYCMFLAFLVIQTIIAYFLIIETKGLTLEDIAVLFDGASAHVAAATVSKEDEKMEEAQLELA